MIDISRRQFTLGLIGGLASLLTRPSSVLAQRHQGPSQPASPPPRPPSETPSGPIPVDSAGDHVTRLHLNLADANDDRQVTPHELQRYRSTLRTPANFTGYSFGDPSEVRAAIDRFEQPYHGDFPRTWRTVRTLPSLARLAVSTALEVAITEPRNKYPGLTNWAFSLGEAYYYSSPFSLSPLQLVFLSTPLLALEHSVAGGLGRRTYKALSGRKVLGSQISGIEAQITRIVVSNITREAAHYGLNRLVDFVPPQRGRFIIL